jgi:hypothetical protein
MAVDPRGGGAYNEKINIVLMVGKRPRKNCHYIVVG